MIEIDDKIVSLDILTENFVCDLKACKGECCVDGNSGAPLEEDEVAVMEAEFEVYKPYMKPEGVAAVERDGVMVLDEDGDLTTTLIDGAECAFSFEEGGITFCAIERAWKEGKTMFRKPVSCHLYPIRVAKFSNGTYGLNYHRWSVCVPAVKYGNKLGVPVYRSLKEPIIRRFGEEFYEALDEAAKFVRESAE